MKSTKSSYSEKLKDPRWQKKRLEVMESNEFCCEMCGDNESTLHVHHKEYLFLIASYIGIPAEKILAWSGRDKSHWTDAMNEAGSAANSIVNILVQKHYLKTLNGLSNG